MDNLGKLFTLGIFGESHGTGVGGTINGCPSNLEIKKELDRRKPGQSSVTTQRKEDDLVQVLSGIFEGKTTGMPIEFIIYNKDADSSKYEKISNLHRPGHSDYVYFKKYGHRDWRGGGFSSGRLTAPIVAAGAVAKKILQNYSAIRIIGYTKAVGDIEAETIDFDEIEKNPVRCPDKEKAKLMENRILEVKDGGDSIGGLVEVIASGVPAGLGEPRFGNLKGELDKAFHSMGAVTAIEYGAGSKARYMKGSEFNDQMYSENGKVKFYSNNSGGIQGGITNGEEIIARLTIKPTPSISKEQKTIDIHEENTTIKIEGRHDPCLCPRIVPVAEALMAIVLADQLKQNNYVK
jgi:chorismate synthase